eukprot:Hpha_TRINITY_DN3054_c0_g1::TRINITY_DN3054_c0_g1_i1::g.138757::m.138757
MTCSVLPARLPRIRGSVGTSHPHQSGEGHPLRQAPEVWYTIVMKGIVVSRNIGVVMKDTDIESIVMIGTVVVRGATGGGSGRVRDRWIVLVGVIEVPHDGDGQAAELMPARCQKTPVGRGRDDSTPAGASQRTSYRPGQY